MVVAHGVEEGVGAERPPAQACAPAAPVAPPSDPRNDAPARPEADRRRRPPAGPEANQPRLWARARDTPPCRAEGAGCMPMHDAYGDAAETLIGRAFAQHAAFCNRGLQNAARRDKRRIEACGNTSASETLIGRAFPRHERNEKRECAETLIGQAFARRAIFARRKPL